MYYAVTMRQVAVPLLLWLLVGTANVPRAEEMTTESTTESTMEEVTGAAPSEIQGPLFHVTTGDDPVDEPTSAAENPEDIKRIYVESEETFLTVFWWWVLGVTGMAGVGALAFWIWGHRQPKRASRL